MRAMRGAQLSLIFQDPMSSLNPVYSVGAQLVEAFVVHGVAGRREARQRGIALLERVGFPRPAERFDDYPHELSGGMRQRVMIAMALACSPQLMIADEPTTALDMLAAAQIGALLAELKHEHQMSLLFISHDIGQVAERADQVVVLTRVRSPSVATPPASSPRHATPTRAVSSRASRRCASDGGDGGPPPRASPPSRGCATTRRRRRSAAASLHAVRWCSTAACKRSRS